MLRRRFTTTLLLIALGLLLVPAAAQAMTFDQAVDKLVKDGWAKKMENKVVSFKGNSLGYRSAGTAADDACARWIRDQFKAIGLSNVALEGVPVDEWDFKSASVTVSGIAYSNPLTYKATGFGGGVPTPTAGITGQVVYVHGGSAADFDAVGDVTGKIVLVDFESSMWWMSMPDMEAGVRGAAAVILTYNPDFPGYYGQEDALAAFDAETDLDAPPMVWISWKNGDVLKDALVQGAVTATVKLNAPLKLIADGGKGYNVVGTLKGSTNKDEYVIFGGHHDAWFQGGLDNASSVVNSLVIAKAAKMSHFTPRRNWVFLSTTAEEYGFTNSWYDWCIGAWHYITQKHCSMAGKIAGMLNTEIVGYKNGNLWMLASPEVTPMLNEQLAASTDLTLTRNSTAPAVIGQPWCWNDQWTFTAAGVPSVSFWSQDNDYSGVYKTTIYHTQYDTPSLINYPFLGDISKFEFRVAKKFDRGLLPYSLSARGDDLDAALAARVVAGDDTTPTVMEVMEDSVDEDTFSRFSAAVDRFGEAAGRFDWYAAHGQLPAANQPATNAQLMQVEKLLNSNLTALDWLDNTSYPFDQITRDIYNYDVAFGLLAPPGAADYDGAAATIAGNGLMWYGTTFSEPVYRKILQQHRQSYYHVAWGGQGHLERYPNLVPLYNAILAHDDQSFLLTEINEFRGEQIDDLVARMYMMADVLDEATAQTEDLFPLFRVFK